MTGEEALAQELKKYRCICYYPSSGTDLSNLDFFCSAKAVGRAGRRRIAGGRRP